MQDYHGNNTDGTGINMWVMGWLSPPEAYVGDNATAFAKIIVDMTRTGLYFQGQHHFAGAVSKYDPEGKLTAVSKAMRRGFWVSADFLLGAHACGPLTACSRVQNNFLSVFWADTTPPSYIDSQVAKLEATVAQMRALMPDSGVYLNECAFSEPDWQQVRATPPLAPARPSHESLARSTNGASSTRGCWRSSGGWTRRASSCATTASAARAELS